ncbi:MAG: TIGR03905 family TSCPD domain-containing protein [Clostridiales bacterium]|nr:TIGR03905 family TSCPD domain-containing protein [Clostridiales bacterium]
MYIYKTSGTCSRKIIIDLENDIIKGVKFEGGCQGNTRGIEAMIVGRSIDEIIEKLSGIKCGERPTSCPDQLAKALKEIKEKRN